MAALTVIVYLTTTLLIWNLYSLFQNYRLARSIGLPRFICPVGPANAAILIIGGIFGHRLSRYLPAFIYDRVKLIIVGWEFYARHTMHAKLGPAFVLVISGSNTVIIAEPEMGQAVLTRRKEFPRVKISSRILGVFGPNLVSADGEEWGRHRRIVAPVLNERIMSVVWKESCNQTRDMVEALGKRITATDNREANDDASDKICDTVDSLRTVTINVINSASYGSERTWSSAMTSSKPPPGFNFSFMDTVVIIAKNLMVSLLLPARLLRLPVMPSSVQRIGQAVYEFPLHAKSIIVREREAPWSAVGSGNTLMGSLVRAADTESSQAGGKPLRSAIYLSEDEIVGNLFNFTIAGFDTTANTLAYAVMILALDTQWQDWIIAEIDEVKRLHPEQGYPESFPLLTRCVALIFETLRLYTPIPHIARIVEQPTRLLNHELPAKTMVQVSAAVIHVSPDFYGPDPLAFRPTRWIAPPSSATKAPRTLACEPLVTPDTRTFLPWSAGPRYCPGTKMSQTEFVAVLATAFAEWRVELAPKADQSVAKAAKELRSVMADSKLGLSTQVRRPKDVRLRWVKR